MIPSLVYDSFSWLGNDITPAQRKALPTRYGMLYMHSATSAAFFALTSLRNPTIPCGSTSANHSLKMITVLILLWAYTYISSSQMQHLKSELARALESLSEKEATAEAKSAQILSLTQEKEAMKQEAFAANQTKAFLEGCVEEAKTELRRKVAELDDMRAKEMEVRAIASQALARHREEVADLKATLDAARSESDSTIGTKDAQIHALTVRKEELQSQVADLERRGTRLEARLTNVTANLTRRVSELEETNILRSKLMAEQFEEIVELRAKLKTRELENKALGEEKAELLAIKERQELKVLELRDRVSEYHRRVNEDNCFDEFATIDFRPRYDLYPPSYQLAARETPGHRRYYTDEPGRSS
ncbi:hypothetical protein NMY22_g8904 [Coprinellus aureogranulatus]|nr:hypothetical protein NMY22_g8904 [Coprinellus aureogranulatus]